jgi:predicted DNA-binding transcriptional regulator AlpA
MTDQDAFLRLAQIIGDRRRNIPPIIPVSAATWWRGVRAGRFPQPVRLGDRITVWRARDIRALIEAAG